MRALAAGRRARKTFAPARAANSLLQYLERRRTPALAPAPPPAAAGAAEARWGTRWVPQCPPSRPAELTPPDVHAAPTLRRPGEVVDIGPVVRAYWAVPLTGFNAVLEAPVHQFELYQGETPVKYDPIQLPADIFGVPVRPDLIFRAYRYYVRAYTGWTERMQLFKWEWKASQTKQRLKCRNLGMPHAQYTGLARMNWRRTPGRWVGCHVRPARPTDHSCKINARALYRATLCALSGKFAQDEIRVVDSFALLSHKTKHCVEFLRRIAGFKAQRVLVVHSHDGGTENAAATLPPIDEDDVNDNFRWAVANVCVVQRQTPQTLNLFHLVRSNRVIFTKKALLEYIARLQDFPRKRGWGPAFATLDGRPAPIPEPVPGWDEEWRQRKLREQSMDAEELFRRASRRWKWSDDYKGPLKVERLDDTRGFELVSWTKKGDPEAERVKKPWSQWEVFPEGRDVVSVQRRAPRALQAQIAFLQATSHQAELSQHIEFNATLARHIQGG